MNCNGPMKSVLYKNESPDQHCAEPRLSNLVSLGRHQMWDKSITESHHLVNPPSNQRYPSTVRGCFDGGVELTSGQVLGEVRT